MRIWNFLHNFAISFSYTTFCAYILDFTTRCGIIIRREKFTTQDIVEIFLYMAQDIVTREESYSYIKWYKRRVGVRKNERNEDYQKKRSRGHFR